MRLSSDAVARAVPCPACRGRSLFAPSNPWRPFCSERCAVADLGAWASEAYRVPAAPDASAVDGVDKEAH